MTDTDSTARPAAAETGEKSGKEEGSFLAFVLKLALAVIIFRSFIFSPFSIPSESMLPRLWTGDYLLAAKWPYGYSSRSMPFGLPVIPGRIFADEPEAGDVVIFQHPVDNSEYIKRAIGLPGDTIQVKNGILHINGDAVARERLGDFVQPITDAMIRKAEENGQPSPCASPQFDVTPADGQRICRYPQYRETLPNGVSFNILDLGEVPFKPRGIDPDNTVPVIVPEGSVFVMGDNRDNSLDSRFPAESGLGVGIVPQNRLVGRATIVMWSTDGSAQWLLPWTWFTAARWDRIGDTI